MQAIDFYFDFFSPYAYLAHHRLKQIARQYSCTLAYRPINLHEAKKVAGNTGPANRDIPVKFRYLMTDLARWADKYGIPLKPASSALDSTRANKGTFFAIDRGQAGEYVTAVYDATWGSGGAAGDAELLNAVVAKLGWPVKEFNAWVDSTAAADRYREGNAKAQHRGVFGTPIMMIGDEMWWGNDRLELMADALAKRTARGAA
jgi:2-hydroxychromene-2-carboxylate isomerase